MRCKRVTFAMWLGFCALHAAATLPAIGLCLLGYGLCLKSALQGSAVTAAVLPLCIGLSILVVGAVAGTPYWGLMWSRAYVGRYNLRRPHYYCGSCGYDLTGNTSGLCPECGTPIEHTREPIKP